MGGVKKMKNLSVVGIGRLGLCFALSLEKTTKYNVKGCDIREDYVELINRKTLRSYEPGVNDLLAASNNFSATTNIREAVEHADLIFVTVATFSNREGDYDVSQVDSVIKDLIALGAQASQKHLIICSNVNPGYSDQAYDQLSQYNWKVSFNPETVAQGTILENQANPDCIYIGVSEPSDSVEIEEVYQTMCNNNPSVHVMDRVSAELTKVSLNCFLASKISFANMVGDLAKKIGASPEKVLAAVGSDTRVDNKFFGYGFGWGGPCFPRDIKAYIKVSKDHHVSYDMCAAAEEINNRHHDFLFGEYISSGRKEYNPEYVTYKEGTNILEHSQQLKLAVAIARLGFKVKIVETEEVLRQLQQEFGELFIYEKKQ